MTNLEFAYFLRKVSEIKQKTPAYLLDTNS